MHLFCLFILSCSVNIIWLWLYSCYPQATTELLTILHYENTNCMSSSYRNVMSWSMEDWGTMLHFFCFPSITIFCMLYMRALRAITLYHICCTFLHPQSNTNGIGPCETTLFTCDGAVVIKLVHTI